MSINSKILVVTSSKDAQKIVDTLKLTCSCKLIKQKTSFSLSIHFAPIDEVLFTTSFKSTIK